MIGYVKSYTFKTGSKNVLGFLAIAGQLVFHLELKLSIKKLIENV